MAMRMEGDHDAGAIDLIPFTEDRTECDVVYVYLDKAPVASVTWAGMVNPDGDRCGREVSRVNLEEFQTYRQIVELAMVTRRREQWPGPDIDSSEGPNLILRICVEPPVALQTIAQSIRISIEVGQLGTHTTSLSQRPARPIVTVAGESVGFDPMKRARLHDADLSQITLFRGLGVFFEVRETRGQIFRLTDLSDQWQDYQQFCLYVEKKYVSEFYREGCQTDEEEILKIIKNSPGESPIVDFERES